MKVIIVGAGIAGLAAGIGLRRAGHDVKIFERSSLLREVGAAINICPNASQVLLQWGFDTDRARFVTARRHIRALGTTLETQTMVEYPDFTRIYGGPWYLSHRVDLHSELRRLATDPSGPGQPVELVLRAEVVDYDAEDGSITLANRSTERADLVVAADGVHTSAVRHVIGHATPVVSTGWSVFRFLLSTDELCRDPDIAPLVERGVTRLEDGLQKIFSVESDMRRLVWYPCANNTVQNIVVVYPNQETDDHEREDWDRSADVDDVLSQLHDFHPDIVKLVGKATDITRWPLLYRDPISTLIKGRMVLIGDAGHPMLPHQGQGGAQSIEDAAALSEVFTGLAVNPSKDEIQNRLAIFDKIRLRRVSAFQILSNAAQDQSWRVLERAQEYMPEGVSVPTTQSEFWAHNFGYDVVEDSRRQMKMYFEGR
ncbi:hypothetical protein BJX99DRAFT_227539 [Aspergillus californicus]